MTQFQGQPEKTSAFNQRSDTAALNIKEDLSRELTAKTGQPVVLPPTPVQVGVDGQPAGPLPPEGTYARSAIEEQQAVRAQQQALEAHQRATDPASAQPAQGAPTQQSLQEPPEQISQRAEQRITSLVSQLRQKDQDFQQLEQNQSKQATTVEELQAQLTASQEQMNSMMSEHMENLDPEARATIMSDARIRQAVAQSEQRILQTMGPRLEALQVHNDQLEKVGLGQTYSGYDPVEHDVLIDEFRRVNRSCSVEQAFRAVATPEELSVGGVRPMNAPPPTVPPGNGPPTPRYLPDQPGQPDPVTQMRMDSAQAAKWARSLDPEDQKKATAMWHKNLSDRLGLNVPGT